MVRFFGYSLAGVRRVLILLLWTWKLYDAKHEAEHASLVQEVYRPGMIQTLIGSP